MAPLKVTRGQIYKAIYNVTGLQPSSTVKTRLFSLIPQDIRRNPSPRDYPEDPDGRIRRESAFTLAREIIRQFELKTVKPQQIKNCLEKEGLLTGAKANTPQREYYRAYQQTSKKMVDLIRKKKLEVVIRYHDLVSELTDELLGIPAEMRTDSGAWIQAILEVFKNSGQYY